jgi:hypothetical protein
LQCTFPYFNWVMFCKKNSVATAIISPDKF